ncbi:uncharacterized protein LOC129760392 [Uranotaenia lowii]|uniref:uncharacterized protein LOC129760392 n=1 Tax=Uranotaenia lowii TaxID=190385 RepID=UPI00247AF516|nr:uncharacterized protein LOC129760392 [Uranotaenia lowii]
MIPSVKVLLFLVISLVVISSRQVESAPQNVKDNYGQFSEPGIKVKESTQVPRNNSKDEIFAYPAEPSAIESKQNANNRKPVFIPKVCQDNEFLYPGDQESDWVCDCKPSKYSSI